MPSMSKLTALACTVAGAVGGAAFVQPGAVRAPALPQASVAGLQRWEQAAPEAEAEAAAEGFPAKGFLAGLALGLGVALAGAQHAQAADAPAADAPAPPPEPVVMDVRDLQYKGDKDFEAKKAAIAKAANKVESGIGLQTWKWGHDYDKKYTTSSTGAGTFLRYNMGNYQIIPSYRGSAADDGTYLIDPIQIKRAAAQRAEYERVRKEVAPVWLKDGGATGNVWPSQGMYKPRTYTSAYQPVRQK